jgi:uncharacterized protein involved in type VI secretion and phage assembly
MANRERQSEKRLTAAVEGRYYGKYQGIVVEGDDTERLGRIRVRVPSVLGPLEVWALPCVPYAGPEVGMFFLPEPGTNVWVEFEGGNLGTPIWTGCFWASNQIPAADHKRGIKFIKTKKATIRIDDDEGTIEISNSSGATILLDLNTIKSKAPASITTQVKARKTSLSVTEFSVNNGALSVK